MSNEVISELSFPPIPQGEYTNYLLRMQEIVSSLASGRQFVPSLSIGQFNTDGPGFKDEDDMVSDSAIATISQQSAKAYIDAGLAKKGYVDRGDPTGWDWEVGDFTTDATWNELDCSSIVTDTNAVAIRFWAYVLDDAASSAFLIRKAGNSNIYVVDGVHTQVANVPIGRCIVSACNSSQVVEYYGSNLTFTTLALVVCGWWLNG